jgi:hypothetical protein
MPDVPNTQGGAAKAPPIPTMDVTPPPPATSTAREIRNQARDIAKQVTAAAREARQQAKDAQKTVSTPGQATTVGKATTAGQATTTVPPAAPDNSEMIPPQVVDISIAFFVTATICIVGLPLARAFARLIDRKAQIKSVPSSDLTPQIRQLQDSVDAMAIELERISEGQRFTAKLLAERSGSPAQ